MKRASNRSCGFTLPEVLAALVFIGIVLPVVMRGVTVALQASGAAKHRVEAAQLAKQKIDEFLIVRDPSTFTAVGDFGDTWPGYAWQSTSLIDSDGLYEITVTVTWVEQTNEKSYVMSTLVYPSTVTTTEDMSTSGSSSGGTP
ncbi:MAG: type II secretion system protein [Tepidisphaeraceae bacterium]